jgi:hypothetical protein
MDPIRELTKLSTKRRATAARISSESTGRVIFTVTGSGKSREKPMGNRSWSMYVEPAIDLHIPERAELTNIMCNQPEGLSSTELIAFRIQAGKHVYTLCNKRGTGKRDRIRQRAPADVIMKRSLPVRTYLRL